MLFLDIVDRHAVSLYIQAVDFLSGKPGERSMTEPSFEPRLREDGTLDPESLKRMGPVGLNDWL